MTSRKPMRKQMRALCAEVHPDDGVEPRVWSRQDRSEGKSRRKARQLCCQVAETLGEVLAGDCGDDVLRNLQVVAVDPAPDSSRLLVTVCTPADPGSVEPGQVLEHLARASGRLRSEVAAAITRRRVPLLAYRVAIGPS